MTKFKDYVKTDFGQVQFGVKRSHLYHLEREKYHHYWAQITTFLIIFLSAFWGIDISQWPDLTSEWPKLIGPIGILCISVYQLVFAPSKMKAIHKSLADEFNRLDMRMTERGRKDDAAAESFQNQRQAIELGEPSNLSVLNVMMHNKLHQSIGDDGENLFHIDWFRRCLAQFKDPRPKS